MKNNIVSRSDRVVYVTRRRVLYFYVLLLIHDQRVLKPSFILIRVDYPYETSTPILYTKNNKQLSLTFKNLTPELHVVFYSTRKVDENFDLNRLENIDFFIARRSNQPKRS